MKEILVDFNNLWGNKISAKAPGVEVNDTVLLVEPNELSMEARATAAGQNGWVLFEADRSTTEWLG